MSLQVRIRVSLFIAVIGLLVDVTISNAQTVIVKRNVNLRPEQSIAYPAIRLLTAKEPPLDLLEPHSMDGYYHVKTQTGEEGYVWSRAVHVSVAGGEPTAGALAGR